MSDDFTANLQGLIDDTQAVLEEHKREQHTPQYEKYLRSLPGRPWTPTQRLQVSRCDVCQAMFEQIVDLNAMLPSKPFALVIEDALAAVRPADAKEDR